MSGSRARWTLHAMARQGIEGIAAEGAPTATDPCALPSVAELARRGERADVTVLEAPAGAADLRDALRAAGRATRRVCLIETTAAARAQAAEAALEAGFDHITPALVPLDAPREFILGHRSVLMAYTGGER